MKLRHFIFILLLSVWAISCISEQERDEKSAKKTMKSFLNAVNEGNYTLLFNLSHKNFLPFAQIIRDIGTNHVKFKRINLLCAKIEGKNAEISVEVEDFNGFIFILDWLLLKENERWTVFHLNYSILLFGIDRFDAVQFSEAGIYMPENDPNMIPFDATNDSSVTSKHNLN
ncbi:MAG: hypothetical protein LBR17_04170 [Bacteroidales bacterium]|jgi:hypothetical protein|nr:hypothetical protein [Bacteroidales bacterium]